MNVIVSNYRTGSTTFAKSLGGTGNEYLHEHRNGFGVTAEFIGPNHETVYKVMPNQWLYEKHWEEFKQLYLEPAEKIFITVRKDFDAQVQSHLYAGTTYDWHPWEPNKRPEKNSLHIDDLFAFGNNLAKKLLKNLEWQVKVFKEFDSELLWLEDRYDSNVKYKRKHYVNLPIFDCKINVEEYFNE